MKINTKATNITLTSDISSYLSKHLAVIEKLVSDTAMCDVEVGKTTMHHKTGDVFMAEINIVVEGKSFYAKAEREDLYAAIDQVRDEIFRMLTDYKAKRKTLVRRGGAMIKNMLKGFGRRGN